MALNYTYCSGGTTLATTSVDLTFTPCSNCTNTYEGDCTIYECTTNITFTISPAVSVPLRVWYTYDYTSLQYDGENYYPYSENGVTGYVDIPAGNSTYTINKTCRYELFCSTERDGGDPESRSYGDEYIDEYTNWEIDAQHYFTPCDIPPVECGLDITGFTSTDVSVRGESDGTITLYMSGATGATVTYSINGNIDSGTSPTGHTFTGLTAGVYNIIAEEGICYAQTGTTILDGEFRTGDFTVLSPNTLCAVENPIITTLSTAINNINPVASQSNFYVDDGTIADGDSITITLEYPQEYTATFYAKGFPNRSNYFLASVLTDGNGLSVGSNTRSEIATSISEVLINDSVINRLYYIRVSGNYVYLVAKEANNKLNLDSSTVTISTAEIVLTNTVAGIAPYDGQIVSNYSLYCDINVDSDSQYGVPLTASNFNRVAELDLPFSITNTHQFDLSQVLKNFVSTPKINFNLTGATTLSSMMAAYYVTYGEKYPLIENSTTKKKRSKSSTDIKYVINSALEWEDDNDMSEYLGTKLSNLVKDISWTASPPTGLTITDYLVDTGSTITTDIEFKLTNVPDAQTFDWQSSPVFTGITGTYPQGKLYISGVTSGITEVYEYDWYSNTVSEDISFNTGTEVYQDINFLTNAPNPKFVQRNSNEFLYFILTKNYGMDLSVIADLYFYDGTSLTGQTLYTIATGGTNYGGVYCVPSGYEQLGLADYETYSGGTRKIRRVDFAVYQSDDNNDAFQLTEERAYRYEIDEQPRRYGVAFLNKRGTWDIFDFSGEIIDSVTHSNEGYEVPRAVNSQGGASLGFQANTVYGTKVTKTIACNTGWIDEDHFNWLIELLSSNRIYNYTDTDQPFLIVNTVSYSKSSNDDLYQIDVTFSETLQQNNVKV